MLSQRRCKSTLHRLETNYRCWHVDVTVVSLNVGLFQNPGFRFWKFKTRVSGGRQPSFQVWQNGRVTWVFGFWETQVSKPMAVEIQLGGFDGCWSLICLQLSMEGGRWLRGTERLFHAHQTVTGNAQSTKTRQWLLLWWSADWNTECKGNCPGVKCSGGKSREKRWWKLCRVEELSWSNVGEEILGFLGVVAMIWATLVNTDTRKDSFLMC